MAISIKSPTATTGSIQLNASDVLTIDSSGNLTVPNNLTVTGTLQTSSSLSLNFVTKSSGTSYSVPSNLVWADVYVIGGGGGGGHARAGDNAAESAGGGGGAGCHLLKSYTKAQLGTTCSYSLGAGGTGAAAASADNTLGGRGGTTTFTPAGTDTTTISAYGGYGGTGRNQNTGVPADAAGGLGGDIDITSTNSYDSSAQLNVIRITTFGMNGVKGSGATEVVNGGDGGNAMLAAGGSGGKDPASNASVAGSDGSLGSGGGGACSEDDSTGAAGGNGGDGAIYIVEYLS